MSRDIDEIYSSLLAESYQKEAVRTYEASWGEG